MGQVLVPSINNINKTNNSNISNNLNLAEPTKKNENDQYDFKNDTAEKEKKLRQKKKEKNTGFPNLDEILIFFQEENFAETEAHKFFNYFESIGWLVGGKIPMTNWQAAAKNWILNAPKFIPHEKISTIRNFDSSPDKNYSEPL